MVARKKKNSEMDFNLVENREMIGITGKDSSALDQEDYFVVQGSMIKHQSMETLCSEEDNDLQASLLERAEKIANFPLDYIPSPEFTPDITPEQERQILSSLPQNPDQSAMPALNVPEESMILPSNYLYRLDEIEVLTKEREIHLFRRFNYLKWKANLLRDRLDPLCPNSRLMDEIEVLYNESIKAKNFLISVNLRLVVSVAKKCSNSVQPIHEMISDGNLSLIRAVEKFDYTLGYKFSTYASWAIYRNFARTIPEEKKHRERFRPSDLAVFESHVDPSDSSIEKERICTEQMNQVASFMEGLDDRERAIIQRRYGLGKHQTPQTLRQVGSEMGVTKERVRQIETRAIAKMRKFARENRIEIPDFM
ncbi:MAG: sigma-70 family RNA polymerase sigma factor [Planctomycetia bacterium]|nr:sigma-70 family RNA polymerase sigma factor [Planctomycetia bacterium]